MIMPILAISFILIMLCYFFEVKIARVTVPVLSLSYVTLFSDTSKHFCVVSQADVSICLPVVCALCSFTFIKLLALDALQCLPPLVL